MTLELKIPRCAFALLGNFGPAPLHCQDRPLAEEEENMISEDERQARQLQLLELGDLREDIMWLNLDASSQSPEVQQVRSEITENLVSAIDEVGRILDRL